MKRFLLIIFAICFLIASPASAKWNSGQWDYELPSDATVVATSGGDYSSIATAVTAASAGDTILVYPGTYTETVTIAVNNLSIVGMGNPLNTIITQANANIIDFGATSGGTISNFSINLSAPTTAIAAIQGSTGSFQVKLCRAFVTCTTALSQANQPLIGYISGAGSLGFNLGQASYQHSGATVTGIKAPFKAGAGGVIKLYEVKKIDINGSGSSNVTATGISVGSGYVVIEGCNIDVDDDTSTSTVGVGYIGSSTSVLDEFIGNVVHVHAADNDAYGAFALLGSLRSSHNHLHVECSGSGTAYSFVESGAGEINSHMDDIIATGGYSGNINMVSSDADGDLMITGKQTFPIILSDDTASGDIITVTFGEDVVFGEVCYPDATDNEYKKALGTNAAVKYPGMGIALESKGNGESGKLLLRGTIRDDSAFAGVLGDIVYLSDGTAGDMLYAAPDTSGDIVQILGFSIADNYIFFNPDYTYVEVP